MKQFPKQTFSGLAKSAMALIDGGPWTTRRAFAMDAKGIAAEDSAMQPARDAARLILQRLPLKMLMQPQGGL